MSREGGRSGQMVERNIVECDCFCLNRTAPELRMLHFQIRVSCQNPVLAAYPLPGTCVNDAEGLEPTPSCSSSLRRKAGAAASDTFSTLHSFYSEALQLGHDLSGHSFCHFVGFHGSMQQSKD